jgi:hypothetical protein
MPLAASITEPPPTAATVTAVPSAASAATAAAPAAMSSVVGLGCTPVNTTAVRSSAASAAVAAATTGVSASTASVTRATAWPPVPRTTSGSAPRVPAPKCAAGRGVYTIRVPVSGWGMVTPVVRAGGAGCRSGLREA